MLSVQGSGSDDLALTMLAEPIAWTVAGLSAYACSLLIWLAVLVRYPLSFAYPLLGLSYALVYVGATHWPRLAEMATPLRTVGTLLILLGVALVLRTDNPESQ
jgi:undecaprenyl phosphate-alpha-L-ara4N flippase subunit ArnF